jgi:hypothetical protein
MTWFETVAAATVCGAAVPPGELPEPPLAWVEKTTFRASRLPAPAPVTCERTGSPTVSQSAATAGSATIAGRNRTRERGVARGDRIRLGPSM